VTEIVLDVSGSVGGGTFGFTAHALGRLSRGGPIGLVVFSDTAEDALPPRTPAAQLEPLRRLFRPLKDPPLVPYPPPLLRYPMSPWYASFSGGTRISAGLAAARKALIRDHVGARIVLISDLGDASDDLSRMKRELVGLEHAGIELRVMPGCGDRRPGDARGRRRPARDHACRERALRRLPALAGGGMSLLMKSAALAALLAAAVALAVAAHSDHRVAALGCLGGGVVVCAAGRADTGRRSALSLRDRALAKLDELTRIGSTAERSPQGPASRARSPPWSPSSSSPPQRPGPRCERAEWRSCGRKRRRTS
jgi:hypothetical protein